MVNTSVLATSMAMPVGETIDTAAFDNFRLPMRGGKRYTKGVLACEIWTEPWAGRSESRHGFFFFLKKKREGRWERK